MMKFSQFHLSLMRKHPWRTVSFTTGFVMSTGDAISQKVIERKENFDFIRYGRYWVFGSLIAGPLFHGWYLRLHRIFSTSKYAPVKMVFVDQTVFAPAFPPFFLGVMGILKGDPVVKIMEKVRNDYLDILKSCWTLWPGVQFVNFCFVPICHRVLFNNVVALGWDTYLAWKAECGRRKASDHGEKDENLMSLLPQNAAISNPWTPIVLAENTYFLCYDG